MLRVIIFDFDGIIADAEPLHLEAFREVLRQDGIDISEKQYYDRYLALDDRTFFIEILKDSDRDFDNPMVEKYIEKKSTIFNKYLKEVIKLFPGVKEFVCRMNERYLLAIGSGALKHEIEFILHNAGIREKFLVIVSAEDVQKCKPDPEVFLKVLQKINEILKPESDTVSPSECLVIEDSFSGIKAAKTAMMKSLAVTNSYTSERLGEADLIVKSLEDVSFEDLEGLF